MYDVTFVFYRKRCAKTFNIVLFIKSIEVFFNKAALLSHINLQNQNYFVWNISAIYFLYIIVPKV